MPDSKEIISQTLIASVRLELIISDPDAAEGYPRYTGDITLPPNKGNLTIKINPDVPADYKFTFSGAVPGSQNIHVDLMPDIAKINRDRTESFRQYNQSGINLNDIRRKFIRDAVLMNNLKEVQVFERTSDTKNFKYLKAFGLRFKFIRKNKL